MVFVRFTSKTCCWMHDSCSTQGKIETCTAMFESVDIY